MKRPHLNLLDIVVPVALATLALTLGILMAVNVTERLPHVEDEIAYLFQARTYARGALWAPVPADRSPFFVPFMIPFQGHWISKYPIGWPMLLAVGELFHIGWVVNPLLSALTVALIYWIGVDLFDRQIGLIAGVLALTSPFYLIQSSTYMSHAASCLWTTVLVWAWLRLERASRQQTATSRWAVLAGIAMGMVAITRPLTGVGVAVPFGVALVVKLIRQRDLRQLARIYGPFVLAAAVVTALEPFSLWIITGSPTTNLYTLVWPYDRIGFGPDISHSNGHDLHQAWINAKTDLRLWYSELFGWKDASWIPLIPGLVFGTAETRRQEKGWPFLLGGIFVSLVIVHLAYWVGAQVYGPRYYYEALAGLAILAALGLRGVVRFLIDLWQKRQITLVSDVPPRLLDDRTWPVYGLLIALVSLNTLTYLPDRIGDWNNLYTINRQPIEAVQAVRRTDHILVLVYGNRWINYGALMSLSSPWLDGPTVVAHYMDPTVISSIVSQFPNREVIYVDGNIASHEPPPLPSPDLTE